MRKYCYAPIPDSFIEFIRCALMDVICDIMTFEYSVSWVARLDFVVRCRAVIGSHVLTLRPDAYIPALCEDRTPFRDVPVYGFVYDGAVSSDGFVRGRSAVVGYRTVVDTRGDRRGDARSVRDSFGGHAFGSDASFDAGRIDCVYGGSAFSLDRPAFSSYGDFIRFYGADVTDSCRPHGYLSDEEFAYLDVDSDVFDDAGSSDDSYPDWDDYDVSSYDAPDGDVDYPDVDDGRIYRSVHWLEGDGVVSVAPRWTRVVDGVRMVCPRPRSVMRLPRDMFYARTRIVRRRSGVLSLVQAELLGRFTDVPASVLNAPAGVHRLDALTGTVKKATGLMARSLLALGFDVRKTRLTGDRREVWYLFVDA